MDETDAIAAVRAGETDRFGDLVAAHLDAIFRFHLRMTGDRAAAEDLAQDTFVAAFRALDKLATPAFFRAWLYGIARHQALNHNARVARRLPEFVDPADLDQRADPGAGGCEVERNERMAALDAAIAELPDEYRAPLTLVAIDQLSYEEAGVVLGLPLGTVKSRIARARRQLAGELRRRGFA